MSEAKVNTPVVGLSTGLTLIFAAAKVFGYISWSWWWVFAPIWISAIAVFGLLAIVLLIAIGVAILSD